MSANESFKPFRFTDLPPELRLLTCKELDLCDLKTFLRASPVTYLMIREQMYAVETARVFGTGKQIQQALQNLIKSKSLPAHFKQSFSPAKWVRKVHIRFCRFNTSRKMASYMTGVRHDNASVGYTSTEALPLILSRITNESFPNLQHLVMEWDNTSEMWNDKDLTPHWYVVKPLLELKRLTRLRTIEIRTKETAYIKQLRSLCAERTTTTTPEDRERLDSRLAHVCQLLRRSTAGNGYVYDLLNDLLNFNLDHSYTPEIHHHSDKCAYPFPDIRPDIQYDWRLRYCPSDCILEELQIEGMHEELVGLYVAKVMSRLLYNTKGGGILKHIYRHFSRRFDAAETRLVSNGGYNLRKRKSVDYLALHTGGRSKKVKK